MATPVDIRGLQQSEAPDTAGTMRKRGFRVTGDQAASLTTALAGANNDLVFTAKTAGTGGNAITVAIVVAGANTPLSVGVVGNAITINSATSAGSAATSTAAQVKAAVDASGPASALVAVALAPGNDGTGVVAAQGATNLTGGGAGANRLVSPLTNVTVDVDVAETRKRLGRYHDQFISVPDGGNLVYIRSIEASPVDSSASGISRGFRIKNAAGAQARVVPGAAAVQVDVGDPMVRKALKQHNGRWIEANNTNSLTTIRGLTVSGASGSLARGFRIKNQAGNQVTVGPTANVQVNVSDAYVRRILRRNRGRYVVVSSP